MGRHAVTVSRWLLVIIGLTLRSAAAQNVSNYDTLADPFLFLIREPAVHEDLSLRPQQAAELATLNARFDGSLLASRNQPPEQARKRVEQATSVSREQLARTLDPQQRQRLQQITYRIRGIGFVLDSAAAEHLQLTSQQQQAITSIVEQTRETVSSLRDQLGAGKLAAADAESQFAAARKNEQLRVLELLDPTQRQRFSELVGPAFDPALLGRVSFQAPDLVPQSTWINSEPQQLAALRGKVVAVHFWAFGCINCIHNYPSYKEWHQAYADRGLVMIGIHTPETSEERQVDQLREKIQEEGFRFPIVVDNDLRNWNAWGNSIWPSVYLIDKQGRLRYWWYGELNWQAAGGQTIMARRIEELLEES